MFERILIANRGEIACRVIRTARRMGMETIAVFSDADARAMHVDMADRAVRLGPAPARDSYLRGDLILEAARRTGAQAIHPGYGFLSENADFADACEAAGIVFIGPPASAIRAMGSKAEAKALMATAGVPLTPGYHGVEQDPDTLKQAADEIGYPVLIKASAGGGGKGMRLVEDAADFAEALESCRREAQASFGDDRVLVERFVTRPRHIEMQVFADAHGNAVHLFERDCSVQRRHQKVLEEATAPGMPDALRNEMGRAAVAAALAVGYRGAGTVEFIAETDEDGAPGAFYFMEMNTRLQVEHPVTEAVTGLDLVAWQLSVAAGEPLPFGQDAIAAKGHAIEARLYAEDPEAGFLPSTGCLGLLSFPEEGEGVRIDTGVRQGDVISPHYDPMIAKVIAHGADRSTAIRKLIKALSETRVAGIASNRDFLIRALGDADFAAGLLDTGFIAAREAALLPSRGAAPDEVLILAALSDLNAIADVARVTAARLGDALSPWANADGWRLNDSGPITLCYRDPSGDRSVIARREGEGWSLNLDGRTVSVEHPAFSGGEHTASTGGVRFSGVVDVAGDRITVVTADRTVVLNRIDPLASAGQDDQAEHALTAPMPGKVIALQAAAGDAVQAGQPLLVLEAMKMEHTIKAPADGVIAALPFAVGDQVEDGAVLVRFEEEEER